VKVNGALLNTAAAALLVLIFVVFCNLGQAVIEPVVLGFFLIEVTWPLYRFLKRKIAKRLMPLAPVRSTYCR